MKTKFLSSILLYWITTTVANGQILPDSIKYLDHMLTLKKKAAVIRHIGLTEAEKSSFWPLFDSYQRATKNFEMESIILIREYAEHGDKYSARELGEFSNRILKNDLEIAKLRKKYFKRFRNALSPERASAFMQLDENFRNRIRIDLQKEFVYLTEEVYTRN